MEHYNVVGQPLVLSPHWFDDTFKTQRVQPVERYLFPNPIVLDQGLSTFNAFNFIKAKGKVQPDDEKTLAKLRKVLLGEIKVPKTRLDKERKAERSAVWQSVVSSDSVDSVTSLPSRVFSGQRILLSADLTLADERRESVQAAVEMNGGTVVPSPKDGSPANPVDYDILITTHDDTLEYMKVITSQDASPDIVLEFNLMELTCRRTQRRRWWAPSHGCFL